MYSIRADICRQSTVFVSKQGVGVEIIEILFDRHFFDGLVDLYDSFVVYTVTVFLGNRFRHREDGLNVNYRIG